MGEAVTLHRNDTLQSGRSLDLGEYRLLNGVVPSGSGAASTLFHSRMVRLDQKGDVFAFHVKLSRLDLHGDLHNTPVYRSIAPFLA